MITASPLSATNVAETLRASIHGDVVTPDEPSFAAATFGMPAELEPEMVVIAADAADVAVTVRLANRTARRIAVQTSARQPQAHSSGAGLRTILLVTRLLAAVSIDPTQRTATVGAGSSWRQVIDAAEPFGLGTDQRQRSRHGRARPRR